MDRVDGSRRVDGLIEGRVVHYVLEDGPSKGEHRPAVIVRVWDQQGVNGCSNLTVFPDHSNDGQLFASGVVWRTSRLYDPEGVPGTWHWPERA